MGLQVARSTPARRAAVGRDSDRAGHSDGLRSALCRAMDRQPIRPRRTPVVGEQVTRLQAVRTYYLPGRRKCPADAGDVVRERPPGLGRDRGVEPALSPKTVAAAAIQSSTRSQLNGKPILQAGRSEDAADQAALPLLELRQQADRLGGDGEENGTAREAESHAVVPARYAPAVPGRLLNVCLKWRALRSYLESKRLGRVASTRVAKVVHHPRQFSEGFASSESLWRFAIHLQYH